MRPAFGLLLAGVALAAPGHAQRAAPVRLAAHAIGYASAIRLSYQPDTTRNGAILLAYERAAKTGGIPILVGDAAAAAWRPLADVEDGVHREPGWRLVWQPNLYETPRAMPDAPPGTILLAANAIRMANGAIAEQELQLYVSTDTGRNWRYRGTIAAGSGHLADGVKNALWEPNLQLLDDGRLVAYYSSEQHQPDGFNQLLAHKVSRDGGRSWGPEIRDVARSDGVERPGMTVTDRLPDGSYVLAYEDIDGPRNGQVYLKFSRDGLDFGDPADRGTPVATMSGAYPVATPTVRWLPLGGPGGRLLVAAQRSAGGGNPAGQTIYWNEFFGQGPWWQMPAPVAKRPGNIHSGWTQALLLGKNAGELLHITSAASAADPKRPEANELLLAKTLVGARRYEAEDAARSDVAMIDDAAMSNGGRVRIGTGSTARLDFTVRADRLGPVTVTVAVRSAAVAMATRPTLVVNGAPVSTADSFRNGAAWTAMTFLAPLRPGANTLSIRSHDGAIDVDYIELPAAS